jgi:hypothetical protein
MKGFGKRAAKLAGAGVLLLLAAGVLAPYLQADRFGQEIKASLEGALGRRVDIGKVRFNLFRGPGFQVEGVVIHEDPSIGIEPLARMEKLEVVPRLWPLLSGHLVAASIRLEDANINLTKTGQPAEPGRWNFDRLLSRSLISAFPGIHVRNGRINFKFGDTKSGFYLMNTDLDITPPSSGNQWSIDLEAEAARTDRQALGLGTFTARGAWTTAPAGDRLDLDVRLERTGLGEITALLRGHDAGVHGTLSAKLHLAGPLHEIAISGRMNIEDVHRWDLLPPKGEGWPLDVRGKLNLVQQELELESSSTSSVPLPLTVRFRINDYLSQPRWTTSLNWNRFPVEPLLELARHMGAQFPPKLKLTGTLDGALAYSSQSSLQGEMDFHDTAVTVPDSPPVRFPQAAVLFGEGHVYLKPAQVVVTAEDHATFEADYDMAAQTLALNIATGGMDVASLRSQVALAAVPWLEQVQTGRWSGTLHYHYAPEVASGWTGQLLLAKATLPVAGLAGPLEVESARAQIDHARIAIDRLQARVGKVTFGGEYRYEPAAARPHRVKLTADTLDAAALEAALLPALERSSGLIARALGRTSLPDWLKARTVEGSLQAGTLLLAGERFTNLRAHVQWDAARLELTGVQARTGKGTVTGRVAVNLRASRPAYKLTGKLTGLPWQGGKLDAEGMIETGGTGAQVLTGLKSEGVFSGTTLDIATVWKTAAGSYRLSWAAGGARLSLHDLQLTSGDETFTGRGATQEDGRLMVVLTNGTREMRMTGATLAKLKLDEPVTR